MASTRELWILLRARDEASRVVSSFSKNVRAAALSAQAAQKSAEAAAIRQQAQMLKANGATATQIRAINDNVVVLEKQARANTMAAAKAREFRAEQLKGIEAQVRANNVLASNLERQAKAVALQVAKQDEYRDSLVKTTGATTDQIAAIDGSISALRKRAATLNAEAAVARSASNSMIAQLQKEQTGLDGSIRSYERRAAAIRAQAAILRNQASALKINLDSQIRLLTNQAAALDKQANAFRQAANAAREHDNKMRHMIQSMGKVSEAATVMAFSLGAIGVGGLVGLKSAIDTTVEYERQVRATATQVDGFKGNLQEIGDIGRRVANEIAVPFETIQPALFDIFSSMEVSMKDAERLLRAFSKAAVAGQVEIQDVSRATIGLLNAFHRPAKDVTKILDMQFQLIQEGIGTYEEWNARIGLVTPSAVRAGQSIEMMMAALAASTRMGISAARSGTAVARAMDAMSHPAAVKNMEELGIKVRDAHGKMLPMNKVLRQFRDVLNKMPMKDRLEAILNVFKGAGGTIEARRFLQNILLGKNGLELFDATLGEVEGSAGSMEKAYEIMANSTAGKTELLRNKWQLLKEAIGQALLPAFNDLIDTLSQVMDTFNRLPQSTKGSIAQFLLWGSIITIVLGAMFAFVGISAVFIAAIGTIGTVAAVTLGIIVLLPIAILAIAFALKKAYDKSATFRSMVKGLGKTIGEFWDIIKDLAASIKESFDEHVLPPLKRLGQVIEEKVLPPARKFADMIKDEILPKVKEAADIIKGFADGALKKIGEVIDNTIIPALEKMSDWWDKNGEKMRPMIQAVAELAKWLLVLGAIIVGVLLVVLVGPILAAIALVVAAFQLWAMVVAAITDAAKDFWEWLKSLGAKMEEIGSSIGEFFDTLWEDISTFFQDALDWIKELPDKVETALEGLPDKVGAVFTRAFNNAAYAVGYGIGVVVGFFLTMPDRVWGALSSLPGRVAQIHQSAMLRAGQIITIGARAIVNTFAHLPTRAGAAVGRLWVAISGHFTRAAQGAVRSGQTLATSYLRIMIALPGQIASALTRVRDAVLGAFAGAGTWLWGAGKDMIRGAINGIGSMIGDGVAAAREAAHRMVKGFMDAIKSRSPSKVFMEIGQFSIQGYAIGLVKEAKRAADTVGSTTADILTAAIPDTGQMRFGISGAGGSGTAGGLAMPVGKVVHQNITVNTQEIDPRRHAAELGWELEGRLR